MVDELTSESELDPAAWVAIPVKNRLRPTRFEIFVAVLILIAIAIPLSLSVQSSREAARRSHCLCNMCGITLALHNYHQANDCLPPAFSPDESGKPRHSWRVSILPYMEQGSLFNMYNFAVAWDAPENTTVANTRPSSLLCPSSDQSKSHKGFTNYVAVQGPGTMFPGANILTFTNIKDGMSQTLAVVEVDNVDIPWTAPLDLDIRTMSFRMNDHRKGKAGPSSQHPGGVNMALADGHKLFLKDSTSAAQLKALISIDGGETIEPGVIPER